MNDPQLLRAQFKIIEGGGYAPPEWKKLPQQVVGRSPFDRTQPTMFRLAQQDVQKGLVNHRYQPLFEAWSMVVGKVPPVPNHTKLESYASRLVSLNDAQACFRGLKRPIGVDARGFDTVAYILKPRCRIVYEPSMVCVAAAKQVPHDLVFVVYVRLDLPPNVRFGTCAASGSPIRGIITHWEMIEADAANANLPIGYGERYRKRLW